MENLAFGLIGMGSGYVSLALIGPMMTGTRSVALLIVGLPLLLVGGALLL